MLYLLLDMGSLSIPLIFSFHPKIRFYTKFKAFFPALIISAGVYIVWDVIFTNHGIWGFNDQYLVGWKILNLPIEEWLFFICIPYACVFTHYTLISIYPNIRLNDRTTRIINSVLILLLIVAIVLNIDKAYTFYNALCTLIILILSRWKAPQVLNTFYLTFLVILLPFFIVNGMLTGSMIAEEVVWYNNAENLGERLMTIPVEDVFYAFGLILLNISLTEIFSKSISNLSKPA